MITGAGPDPLDRIAPAVGPGDRLTVRHRLPDGSATDVVGWVDDLDQNMITLDRPDGSATSVPRPLIIVARRLPPAAGGPHPLRTGADALQRIAAEGWVDAASPCGDWLLRAADRFTRRANSALAVGDPGGTVADGAAAVIDFYARRGLPPLAQVIAGDPLEDALRGLGWVEGGPDTELMVTRLADLLTDPRGRTGATGTGATRTGATRAGGVRLEDRPDRAWLEALAAQRGIGADRLGAAALRVITGDGRAVFATAPAGWGAPTAIGRGHLTGDWLGVSGLWTDPAHRRRGHATAVLLALAGRAARRGARYAYLQVERDNVAARAGYLRLGFRPHHDYRYLRPD